MSVRVPEISANLIAHLGDPRFDSVEVHHAIEELDRSGITITRENHAPDFLLAWIDETFGDAMSSEAARGGVLYARDAHGLVGFAAFDARAFEYRWLRPYANERDLGIVGPIGVAERGKGHGLDTLMLRAAMFALRERGYRRALATSARGDDFVRWFEREMRGSVVDRFERMPPDRRYRTTILASGNGSNFSGVVEAAAVGDLPLDVTAVVVNRPGAGVFERARAARVPARGVVWDRVDESRAAYDARVFVEVEATQPELVLLLGWMHVLPEVFVDRYACLNVHPAYLPYDVAADSVVVPDGSTIPAFRGAHAVDDALKVGSSWIGASFHRVGVEVDRGSILARLPMKIVPGEPREALDARLHALERTVVATGIERWTWEQT